jgi:hypothetical protein
MCQYGSTLELNATAHLNKTLTVQQFPSKQKIESRAQKHEKGQGNSEIKQQKKQER